MLKYIEVKTKITCKINVIIFVFAFLIHLVNGKDLIPLRNNWVLIKFEKFDGGEDFKGEIANLINNTENNNCIDGLRHKQMYTCFTCQYFFYRG